MGVRKIKTKQNERNSSRNHVGKKRDTTIENDFSVSNVAEICLHGTTCQGVESIVWIVSPTVS